jgi:hypothetical protein
MRVKARVRPPFERDRLRHLVVAGIRQALAHGGRLCGRSARHKQAAAVRGDAFGDRGHLLRRLAHAEHDFREAVAQAAMVIDLGEAEVFVGEETQALDSGGDADVAAPDAVE